MVTENANFKINHVNNCAYSTTDGVQNLYNLSGKLHNLLRFRVVLRVYILRKC